MPPKKREDAGRRKSPASTPESKPPNPMEPEIIVQNPPETSTPPLVALGGGDAMEKIFHEIESPEQTPLETTEELLFNALWELRVAYNPTENTKPGKIMIERSTFERTVTLLHEAWNRAKTTQRETNKVTDAFKQIQESIASLENKYEATQRLMKEKSNAQINKLGEIQAITNSLENKLQTNENTVKGAPKLYAGIVNSPITNAPERVTVEMRARHKQMPEALRQKRVMREVTLTTREANNNVKETVNSMSPEEITKRFQKAIDKAAIPGIKLQGISKVSSGIRIHCKTEEQAKQLHAVDWNEAFEGITIHKTKYGIVIHGVPVGLDLNDKETIKKAESANKFPSGTIIKMTPLYRKGKEPSNQKHRSIIMYLGDRQLANECLDDGCYIDSLHYHAVRFAPGSKRQCYNCYGYGHQASACKRNPRCGKCAGNHKTKECNNTAVQCLHCKGPHEAWRSVCPV